ncbi:MAG: hypothetical protein K2K57_00435 [Oscillospiraceae bacterium]|nr:hypothetical protein [Oscillospiraceae bacterium]
MIYDKFPQKAMEIGGIDIVGVVSKKQQTAVIYSGYKALKKYYGGGRDMSIVLQITGLAGLDEQKELTLKLCGIMDRLVKAKWEIPGAQNIRCRPGNFPVPTVKNEHFWIYSCSVNITFYTKEEF